MRFWLSVEPGTVQVVVALAAVLAVALGAWLTLVQPFLGRRRYRRLVERVECEPSLRLHHYRRGIATEWAAAALVGLLALLTHRRLPSLWPPGTHARVIGELPGLVAALVVITLVYRLGGDLTRRALATQLRPVAALLPRSRQERWTFALLAVTAGICEELIYRGFGLVALRWAFAGISGTALIAITAVAFGLAHLYQGRIGVILTGVLGAYLAWITIATGSLLPVMFLHAVVDLRILALPLGAVPLPGSPSPEVMPTRRQPFA